MLRMTYRQLVAALTMFACVAYVQPGVRVAVAQTAPQTAQAANAQTVSVTVVTRGDNPVAGVRLRLRNIDSGTTAGQGISDAKGTFSFSAPPGLYVVEAVNGAGGVIAVSPTIVVNVGTVSTMVRLPSDEQGVASSFTSAAILVLVGASNAGILVWATKDPDSPER